MLQPRSMTCACGLKKTVCEGSPSGVCSATAMTCGPEALEELRKRVRERLLDAWRHACAGTDMEVPEPGGFVRPGYSKSVRSAQAAEAMRWFRLYLRPGIRRGWLEDEEARALGLWLSHRTGMLSQPLNETLNNRAGDDRKERWRIKREFWRRRNKAFDTIVLRLLLDGVAVAPVVKNDAVQQKIEKSVTCPGLGGPQQAERGRAGGISIDCIA